MKRILSLTVMLAPSMAFAHPGHDGGMVAGFVHPFTGADHLLAMTAIGLWAALHGGRALWVLPLAFLASMALGFGLATQGFISGLAGAVEPAVLASVILLGATVALALRAPLALALPAAGLMGLAHGAAHGGEVLGSGLGFAASSAGSMRHRTRSGEQAWSAGITATWRLICSTTDVSSSKQGFLLRRSLERRTCYIGTSGCRLTMPRDR